MNAEGLLIQEQKEERRCRFHAVGDLIITTAQGLQRHIDRALEEGFEEIVLDLSEVDYIDSFGIGVVVKTKSEVDKKKGRFSVVVNRNLLNLFEKCHLDDYIDLEMKEEPPPKEE